MSKTFDCVFITIDKLDRKSVRVANDYAKRLKVLQRDMKHIVFEHDFQSSKTLDEILVYLDANADINDEEVVDKFRAKLVRSKQQKDKTSAQDILAVIAARKQTDAVAA